MQIYLLTIGQGKNLILHEQKVTYATNVMKICVWNGNRSIKYSGLKKENIVRNVEEDPE